MMHRQVRIKKRVYFLPMGTAGNKMIAGASDNIW